MTIIYILHTGSRRIKFVDASSLDDYLKSKRLPEAAIIEMTDENGNNIGTISVKKYLHFENLNK